MAVVCSFNNVGNWVALTFNDDPLIPYTQQILEVLARHDAQATFFVRGTALTTSNERDLVEQASRDGHEIGNHTQNHIALDHADAQTVSAEISKTHNELAELLGAPPI